MEIYRRLLRTLRHPLPNKQQRTVGQRTLTEKHSLNMYGEIILVESPTAIRIRNFEIVHHCSFREVKNPYMKIDSLLPIF